MHLAASKESLEILQFMVENKKLNIDDRNIYGDTPLFIAVLKGNLPIIQYLIDNGADPNIPEKSGHTPFMAACSNGHLEIVNYFLQFSSINFKAKNIYG